MAARPADAPADPPAPRRRATTTSAFGVGRREGHDASGFYGRFTPPLLSDDARVVAPVALDTVWAGDARDMDAYGSVADDSVALVVTSPPYFAGKEYEESLGVQWNMAGLAGLGGVTADGEELLDEVDL